MTRNYLPYTIAKNSRNSQTTLYHQLHPDVLSTAPDSFTIISAYFLIINCEGKSDYYMQLYLLSAVADIISLTNCDPLIL